MWQKSLADNESLCDGDTDTEGSLVVEEEDIQHQIDQLESQKASVEGHLKQVDALWQRRRKPLLEELQSFDAQRAALQANQRMMRAAKNEWPPAPGPSWLQWVDDSWFGTLCNIVILLNLCCMAGSKELEHAHLGLLWAVLEQLFLAWYIFELAVKAWYHQRDLFLGKASLVWWSWLDLGIVVSGVLDQWLLPLFVSSVGAMSLIGALRVFRVLRVLKLLKAFWFSDFSWAEKPLFETLMAGVIAVNSVTMWLELDYDWPIWPYVENIFLIVYSFELVVRLRCQGCGFFTDTKSMVWNVLDFIMVGGGVSDLWLMPAIALIRSFVTGQPPGETGGGASEVLKLLKMMRILRVLRLVRLLRTIKPLYRLLIGVAEALMAMQWVMVLTLLVLYAGAVTWTTLIGKGLLTGQSEGAEENFGTVPESLFSLFKLMNGDTSVVTPIAQTVAGRLMFAGFMVLSNWAVLAILTSVVSDNMMSSSAKTAQEDLEQQKVSEQAIRAERVRSLFQDVDTTGSGAVTMDEMRGIMEDRITGEEMRDATCLSNRSLEDTLEYLEQPNNLATGRFAQYSGNIIMYEDFISHIDDSDHPADNRSLMHLTAQMREMQKQVARLAR